MDEKLLLLIHLLSHYKNVDIDNYIAKKVNELD